MRSFIKIVSAFFVFTSLCITHALSAEVGSITLLVGQAHIERGTEKLSVANGIAIEERDSVITASNARVQITFNDQTVITLGSQSRLSVKEFLLSDSQAPKANFSITQGAFKAITGKIGKIAPQNFKLETKTATIGIRGTIIEGRVGIDEDIIQCIQGSIIVSSLNPSLNNVAPVIVEAGEMTIVGINTPPAPAAPIPEGGMGLVSSASQESQENQATGGETSAQGEASQSTSEREATSSTNKEGSTPASSENQSTASTTQATPADRQAGANTSSSQAPSTPSTLAGDSLASLGSVAQPSQERGSDTNQTRKVEEQIKNLTPPEPEPLPKPEPKPEEKPKPEPIPDTGNHGNQGGSSSGSGSGGSSSGSGSGGGSSSGGSSSGSNSSGSGGGGGSSGSSGGGSSSGGSSSGSNSSGSGGGGGSSSSGSGSQGQGSQGSQTQQSFTFTPHATAQDYVIPNDSSSGYLLGISEVKWQGNRFILTYRNPQDPDQTPRPTLEVVATSNNSDQIVIGGTPWAFILRDVARDQNPSDTPGRSLSLAGGVPYGKDSSGQGIDLPTHGIAQTTRNSNRGTSKLMINYATKELLDMRYDGRSFSLLVGKIKPNGEVDPQDAHYFIRSLLPGSPARRSLDPEDIRLRLYGKEGSGNYIIGGYSALQGAPSSGKEVEFIAGRMSEDPSLGATTGELSLQGFGVSPKNNGWDAKDNVTIKFNRQESASGDRIKIESGNAAQAISTSSLRAYMSDDEFAFFDKTSQKWLVSTPKDDDNEYLSWGYWGSISSTGYWGNTDTTPINYWVAGKADSAQAAAAWIANKIGTPPGTSEILKYKGGVMGHINVALDRNRLHDDSEIKLAFNVGGGNSDIIASDDSKLTLKFDGGTIKVPILNSAQGNAIDHATNPGKATFKGAFGAATIPDVQSPVAAIGEIRGGFYGDEAQAIGGAFQLGISPAGSATTYQAAGVFHGKKQ